MVRAMDDKWPLSRTDVLRFDQTSGEVEYFPIGIVQNHRNAERCGATGEARIVFYYAGAVIFRTAVLVQFSASCSTGIALRIGCRRKTGYRDNKQSNLSDGHQLSPKPRTVAPCEAVSGVFPFRQAKAVPKRGAQMTASGLGRVKTPFRESRGESRTGSTSGHDRGHQRLGPNDVHNPGQIVGQDREGHFGGYFWEGFGQEVRRTHARLHGAERMLDGLAT
ncbi:hypothetical protein ABIB87_006856 [Bradyrhizobium sp. JR18.2]